MLTWRKEKCEPRPPNGSRFQGGKGGGRSLRKKRIEEVYAHYSPSGRERGGDFLQTLFHRWCGKGGKKEREGPIHWGERGRGE